MNNEYESKFSLDCNHAENTRGKGLTCKHFGEKWQGYITAFTGHGTDHNFICKTCAETYPSPDIELIETCKDCLSSIVSSCDGIVGKPGIVDRCSSICIANKRVVVSDLKDQLDPIVGLPGSSAQYLGLTPLCELVRLDLEKGSATKLAKLNIAGCIPSLDPQKKVKIEVSRCGTLAAICNLYGSYGAVIDLATGMTKMTFGRGWNDVGICKFPVAFCTACDGSPLLVHSSAWNRLDISDANSGRLLTERTPIPWSANGPAREHDLNFFHCQLLISPDQTWIAEDGLCYPYKQGKDATGIPRIWNLQKWLHENVFESEDGSSIRTVGSRYELWDSPMCWINDQTLAVYGVDIEQLGGGNDPLVIDGVSILDAVAGKEISCFPGPIIGQQLHYDQVLIAFGAEAGTSVWDVKTGNRLWHDTALKPAAYHAGARQFVTQICAGEFEIARLSGI